jgi:hypothetical protein
MLYFAKTVGEPVADFFGMVFEGAVAAFVNDAASLINNVEALGPCGVSVVRGVAHFVDAKRNGILEALGEIVGYGDALLESFGLRVANVVLVFFVGFHLPLVERVGFTDINSEKIGAVFIVVIDLRNVANLAAKGWSSETAEDKNEWPALGAFANVKAGGAIERDKGGIRGVTSDTKIAAMHMRQGVSDHADSVFGTSGHDAETDSGGDQKNADGNQRPFEDGVHSCPPLSNWPKRAIDRVKHYSAPGIFR